MVIQFICFTIARNSWQSEAAISTFNYRVVAPPHSHRPSGRIASSGQMGFIEDHRPLVKASLSHAIGELPNFLRIEYESAAVLASNVFSRPVE